MGSVAIQKKFVFVDAGEIAYLETGSSSRPPVLFVHGIPTSSYLWRDVLRFLQNDFHCYAPDLMGLGDTRVDPATTCFDMDAQAEMLADFMRALGHETFGLVCHDQGGAAAQILATRMKERVRCFVITDAVCYDNWPVPVIALHQKLAQIPLLGEAVSRFGIAEWIETATPLSAFRRGVFDPRKMTTASIQEYLRPLRAGPVERERFRAFLLAGHPRFTEQVVPELMKLDTPTCILWAGDDRYISPSWGRKLFEDIPGAERFELIAFCGHFWQEERPSEFSSYIGEFLGKHLTPASTEERPALEAIDGDGSGNAPPKKRVRSTRS